MDPVSDRYLIIPIFLPHQGCPHRCVFCNQSAITRTEPTLPSEVQLQQTVESYLGQSARQYDHTQIAFYGGNFLGLDPMVIRSLLKAADRYVKSGKVNGIRFSTRPDTIDARRLELIAPYPIQTVELGAQSMEDEVLCRSNRGHSAADTISAVGLLQQTTYEIGLQLMIGLPGETRAGCFRSAEKAAELRPDFVRIYPAVVVAGSRLAEWYEAGEYSPLGMAQCLERVKQLVLFFNRRAIRISRIGLQADQSPDADNQVVAGPYHPAFGHLVHCELFFDMARLLLSSVDLDGGMIVFDIHPRSISRLRGLQNQNFVRLCNEFAISDLRTRTDPVLPVDGLRLSGASNVLTYADLQCDI